LAAIVPASPAAGASSIPDGFSVLAHSEPSPGVTHFELGRTEPEVLVHVAKIAADAPVSLRAVLSNEQVAGEGSRLERTSSMCARVRCIVGLNGDFADVDTDQPLGGLVTNGQLLRSPSETHHQLSLTKDGTLSTQNIAWSAKLVPTDLKDLQVRGVNVDPKADAIVLYTPAFAPKMPAVGQVTSLVVRTVEPSGPMRLGQTTLLEITGIFDAGEVVIPADGAVLAGLGTGGEALRDLWNRVQSGAASARALFRIETPSGIVESLGGSPILIREGKRWYAEATDNFTVGRHPRSIVGWNPAGETFLVTVDGRQPGVSAGMTLAEATKFMIDLGATEAINLDGGGSSTFVVNGAVANQPSDVAVKRGGQQTIRHMADTGDKVVGHVERPVASALMVIPSTTVSAPPVDPLAGPSLDLPQALALPARSSTDPGSVPDGGLPALIPETGSDLSSTLRVTAVAANLVVATSLLAYAMKRRTRRPVASLMLRNGTT
jgi:hypothetical protein